MRTISKSKLLALRQCPKRLWLEVHRPDLREDSVATQSRFNVGHKVGEIARQLYDPTGRGVLIDPQADGMDAAFAKTRELLQSDHPVFEAGFCAEGALAFADVMIPVMEDDKRGWRMIEVKSSTSVKDYHRDDAAVQSFLALRSGVPLKAVAIAHIDSSWTYPGNDDYQGLLRETDVGIEAFAREAEVREWIGDAAQVLAEKEEPQVVTGAQCSTPYGCGFLSYCQSTEPQAIYPIRWLPGRLSSNLSGYISEQDVRELSDVPDHLLNTKQRRVKEVTLSGEPYFNQKATAEALAEHHLPVYFMDFETIQFAVPIWSGTRPFQQIPFQFSVHYLSDSGITQHAFLDISGSDPSMAFAKALISACGDSGAIFVYNASFETTRIRELAQRYPDLSEALLAVIDRVVDLLPVAREHYYHPSQKGSWSIKVVTPAICPDLSYGDLQGVEDGGMAMSAFLEAIDPNTSDVRKGEIERQLLAYCALDTYAMVRMWEVFTGRRLS